MKLFKLFSLVACLFLSMCIFTRSVRAEDSGFQTIVGAGASYNQYNVENPVDGNLLFASKVKEGSYSFNLVDIVTLTRKPYTIALSFTPGFAQKMFVFNNIPVYATVNVGVMTGGTANLGYSFSSGATAPIGIGKNFMLMPNFRVLKGSLVDTQYIFGMMIGWGSK